MIAFLWLRAFIRAARLRYRAERIAAKHGHHPDDVHALLLDLHHAQVDPAETAERLCAAAHRRGVSPLYLHRVLDAAAERLAEDALPGGELPSPGWRGWN